MKFSTSRYQLIMFPLPPPEASEVVTPRAVEMGTLLTWWELYVKGFSKTSNDTIPWKEHKLDKWLKASYPCQLMWIPNTTKGVILD